MTHIAVIGAGITGVTSAYALLQRGFKVTVFERHRYPAMETSFANGGQLSASNAEVWNRTSTVLHGLQWMLRQDAPLLFNPMPSWHKYSWIVEFLGQVAHYKRNTLETVKLALAARDYLFRMAEAEQIEFDLQKKGILHIYKTESDFRAAGRANKLLNRAGLERFSVTPEEMKGIEPALTGEFYGGYFTPSDATGDIHKFTRGLAAACIRLGATFKCESVVEDMETNSASASVKFRHKDSDGGQESVSEIEADAIVISAGVESRNLAAALGDRVNIYPVKGYSISVYLDGEESQRAAPTVSLLDDNRKIVTSRLGDRFRVAGTAEFNGFNRDIRQDRIAPLIAWTREYFPGVATDRVVPWSGLRPMTPSMLPRVGAARKQRIFYNTGHGHLGWTLAAATAHIIALQIDRTIRR